MSSITMIDFISWICSNTDWISLSFHTQTLIVTRAITITIPNKLNQSNHKSNQIIFISFSLVHVNIDISSPVSFNPVNQSHLILFVETNLILNTPTTSRVSIKSRNMSFEKPVQSQNTNIIFWLLIISEI